MIDHQKLYEQCKSYSVLFVEDFAPLREKVIEILENYFYRVISAKDGQEGWEKYQEYSRIHKKPIDIVLTDISMPRKNGLELSKDIKELFPKQLIVVLSAHQDSEQLIAFINIGVSHYLLKPINPTNLLEVMSSVTQTLIASQKFSHLGSDSKKIELGDGFVWDSENTILYQNNSECKLTQYDLIVMELLSKKLNTICTIEELIAYFYAKNLSVDSKNIRSAIFRLRQKLPDGCISSLYAVGYKLSRIV